MEKSFHLWFLFMILFVSQSTGLLYRDLGSGVWVMFMKTMGSALPGKDWNTYVLLNKRGLVDMLLIGSIWQHCRIFTVLKTATYLTVCDMNCPETYAECKTKPLFLSASLTGEFCFSWRGSQLRKVHHPLVQRQQVMTQTLLLPQSFDIRERLQRKSLQFNKVDKRATRAHPELYKTYSVLSKKLTVVNDSYDMFNIVKTQG